MGAQGLGADLKRNCPIPFIVQAYDWKNICARGCFMVKVFRHIELAWCRPVFPLILVLKLAEVTFTDSHEAGELRMALPKALT